jgi:hypothetical protein
MRPYHIQLHKDSSAWACSWVSLPQCTRPADWNKTSVSVSMSMILSCSQHSHYHHRPRSIHQVQMTKFENSSSVRQNRSSRAVVTATVVYLHD